MVVVVVVVVGSSVVVSNVSPAMISVRFKSSKSVKFVPVASSILSKIAVSEESVELTAVTFEIGIMVSEMSVASVSRLVSLLLTGLLRAVVVLIVEEEILSVTGGRNGISPTEVSFKCISTVALGAVISGKAFFRFQKIVLNRFKCDTRISEQFNYHVLNRAPII